MTVDPNNRLKKPQAQTQRLTAATSPAASQATGDPMMPTFGNIDEPPYLDVGGSVAPLPIPSFGNDGIPQPPARTPATTIKIGVTDPGVSTVTIPPTLPPLAPVHVHYQDPLAASPSPCAADSGPIITVTATAPTQSTPCCGAPPPEHYKLTAGEGLAVYCELAAMGGKIKDSQAQDLCDRLKKDYGIDAEISTVNGHFAVVNKATGDALIVDSNGDGTLSLDKENLSDALKSVGIDPLKVMNDKLLAQEVLDTCMQAIRKADEQRRRDDAAAAKQADQAAREQRLLVLGPQEHLIAELRSALSESPAGTKASTRQRATDQVSIVAASTAAIAKPAVDSPTAVAQGV